MKSTKAIAYYRVSTKRQSLGLDAQRAAVLNWAATNNVEIIEEIHEKESGREDARPGLSLAIAKAKHYKAALVAAKSDRISRDVSYAAYVFFKAGIEVIALNLPQEARQDPLLFSVYFGLAQQEANLISDRTKAALAALKAQGVKLGRPDATITPEMIAAAAAARQAAADNNTANLAAAAELKRYFAKEAKRNLSAAARHLNGLQLYTSRGVFHTAQSVKNLIARYSI